MMTTANSFAGIIHSPAICVRLYSLHSIHLALPPTPPLYIA
jgi:hypothetical protein